MRQTLMSILIATALTGCVGGVRTGVRVSATTPDLVFVGPGVQVIADYDEPIFFADGYYWWSVDGAWYRSTYYTGGWAYHPAPPLAIARIHQPVVYRHYRPAGYVARNRPVPAHRVQRPVVREHRSDIGPPRDHRRW